MYEDELSTILENAIDNTVTQWHEQGVPDEVIKERLNQGKLNEHTREFFQAITNDYKKFFKENRYEISYRMGIESNKFLIHMQEIWGECFIISETMYVIATEAAELYCKYVSEHIPDEEKAKKEFTFIALQRIHGRCCQEFLEILHLMKLGFADGAYARWRSMYELCCYAKFITEYGENIAKQYVEQPETERNRLSWTKGAQNSDGKKVNACNFQALQYACQIDERWKKQYRLACFVNHGDPQGTFGRLGQKEGGVILIGQSDYGIDVPAEHSAIALSWISTLFFSLFPNMGSNAYIKMLYNWDEEVRKAYFDTSDRCFGTKLNYGKGEEPTA